MPSVISRMIDCFMAWKCRARSDCCRDGGCVCDVVEGDTKLSRQSSLSNNTPHGVSDKKSSLV